MFRRKHNPEELPPHDDFDVVVIGMAAEGHYDAEPREGLANPQCRAAARIAVGALRSGGRLEPSLGSFIDAEWPKTLREPLHSDISDQDPDVVLVATALKAAGDVWSQPHAEFGQIAVATLMRNQRLPLPEASPAAI